MRWSGPGRCAALVAAVLTVAVAGCGGGGTTKSARLRPAAPPPKGPELARDVAQLFAVGFHGTTPRAPFVDRLRRRGWGVVVLAAENLTDGAGTGALVRALDDAGPAGGGPSPLIAATSDALPAAASPGEPDQSTPALARAAANAAATKLHALGVGLVLAPVADVGYVAGPAAGEAFSTDPPTVAKLTVASVEGWKAGGVAPAPGHFPGQGAASQDPEQGVATVGFTLRQLRATEVVPFAAVDRIAPAIQLSDAVYAAWDGVTPASLLPEPYDLLRRGLGFRGAAITGDLTATTAATGGSVGAAAVRALQAGADLLYVPGAASDQEAAYTAVLDAVRRGRVTAQRLEEALGRVATLKREWSVPAPAAP